MNVILMAASASAIRDRGVAKRKKWKEKGDATREFFSKVEVYSENF
jgi:hypothetical protein